MVLFFFCVLSYFSMSQITTLNYKVLYALNILYDNEALLCMNLFEPPYESFQYHYQTGNRQKKRFMALSDAYHGETLGALAVGGVDLYSELYKKDNWKKYQKYGAEHAEVVREHRRYKQKLFLEGKI